MINLIIGHRGTGKSYWLKIIDQSYKNQDQSVKCYDLDKEIEKFSKKNIKDLFLQGEQVFRGWEKKVFKDIIQNVSQKDLVYIAVGAGFQFEKNKNWNIIFLSRFSDSAGRVFLNRPALSNKSPFEEYHNLYQQRQEYYLKQCDEQFYRLEHFKDKQQSDKLFLGLDKINQDLFSLALHPHQLSQDENKLKIFLEKRLDWGIRFFEVHDSTASKEFIQKIQKFIPKNKLLFSSQKSDLFCSIPDKTHWSWDLSLGEPPHAASILSLHDRSNKTLKDLLLHFSQYKNKHLKLAVEIFNLSELKQAYDWWKQDPEHRSFLPRSQDGCWRWFRNAFGSKMFLNFIREGDSTVLDQPFFTEAIHFSKNKKALAAVLGFPIEFSATPFEQNSFFYEERSIPVLPIPLKEEELTKQNLKIFQEFGFVFFAATSPLKKKAFKVADSHDQKVKNLASVNTLIFHNNKWQSYNTDIESVKALQKQIQSFSIKVWGGGGVRSVFQFLFPQAIFYSARSGKPVAGQKTNHNNQPNPEKSNQNSGNPNILIWAVGRKRMENCVWPPKDWTFHKIIDLNYMEDSPGKEYALNINAQYENGYNFFKQQAAKQREIFLEIKEG